ncbi:MAG: heavy metal translocating P-type ATPase metal-binding domain-containing protein [Cyclobacteriaceae bacterium]|nr:heavy metal translocating P-type ATPase metal-binding domain-containing protein [Cyclobacteriaceae bacterium]
MAGKESAEKVVCYHCGDVCTREHIVFDKKDFCCNGCKTVYEILSQNDLCTYYDLSQNPGINLKSRNFDDKYAFLDNADIARLLFDYADDHRARITFTIPSIHCSSCIWLLENLYKLRPGILHNRVNFVRKELNVDFDPGVISLRQLVELLATLGYEPQISLEDSDKKQKKSTNRGIYLKIGVAAFAFGNIMLLSFPEYFGFEGLDPGVQVFISYLNILLSLPVVIYCASDYYKSAWAGLKNGFVNIDVPISIGIITLFLRSLYEVLIAGQPGYLDSLAGLLFFLLVGRWFQNFTYQGLSFERDYRSYFPLAIGRYENDAVTIVPVRDLKKGDRIRVRNREIIPADCILMSARAAIDYSFVTGESNPVTRNVGDYIYAGGRQVGENITLEVVKPVAQSYLTQLWNNETFSKSETGFEAMINRISKNFTFAVLIIAIAGFGFWVFTDISIAMNAFTAVLIVACPCALSMATPFTLGSAMRIFGENRFYLKDASVIEKLHRIQHIVFDKTGTITFNQENDVSFHGHLSHDDLKKIKSLALNSTHPLSRAIVSSIDLDSDTVNIDDFHEISGEGLRGTFGTDEYRLGRIGFVIRSTEKIDKTPSGATVYISKNGELMGHFTIENKYREGLYHIVERMGKKHFFSIITGDNASEGARLREIFGAHATYRFNQSPQDKLDYVANLQKKEQVLMIGDGLNDAGALRQSEVGISITDDTSGFTPASDAIMTSSSLEKLPDFMDFSHISHRIIIAAFIISFLYNIIGISFALSGTLSPLVAAILMPLSSISVVVFATVTTNLMAKLKKLL